MNMFNLSKALIRAYRDGYTVCRYRPSSSLKSYEAKTKTVLKVMIRNNGLTNLHKEIWTYSGGNGVKYGIITNSMNKTVYLFLFQYRND